MGDRLNGKTAIVTGAGSVGPGWGNGKAAAVLFAREGAAVFAVDIDPDAAARFKRINHLSRDVLIGRDIQHHPLFGAAG